MAISGSGSGSLAGHHHHSSIFRKYTFNLSHIGETYVEVSMVHVLTDQLNTLNIFFAISGEKQNTNYIHVDEFEVKTAKLTSELL